MTPSVLRKYLRTKLSKMIRIAGLEKELKEARDKAEAADAAYEEVSKKLLQCDGDLEKA